MAAGALAVLAQHRALLAGAVGTRVPTAVGRLGFGQPFQGGLHGGLGFGRAAAALRHAGTIGSDAQPIGFGQGLLGVVARPHRRRQRDLRRADSRRFRIVRAGWLTGGGFPGQAGKRRRGEPIRDQRPRVAGRGGVFARVGRIGRAGSFAAQSLDRPEPCGGQGLCRLSCGGRERFGRVALAHLGQRHDLLQKRGGHLVGRHARRLGRRLAGHTIRCGGNAWSGHRRGVATLGGRGFDGRGRFVGLLRLGHVDHRRQRFRVGHRHVLYGRIAGQFRVLGSHEAFRLDRFVGRSAFQLGWFGRGDGLTAEDLPRPFFSLGHRRRGAAGSVRFGSVIVDRNVHDLFGGRRRRGGHFHRGGIAGQEQMGQKRHGHALAQRLVLPPTRVHQHGQAGRESGQSEPEQRDHRFQTRQELPQVIEMKAAHGLPGTERTAIFKS